jgi:hypothetical protein
MADLAQELRAAIEGVGAAPVYLLRRQGDLFAVDNVTPMP